MRKAIQGHTGGWEDGLGDKVGGPEFRSPGDHLKSQVGVAASFHTQEVERAIPWANWLAQVA